MRNHRRMPASQPFDECLGTFSRRHFLGTTALALASTAFPFLLHAEGANFDSAISALPSGSAPDALPIPWFPSRLHAFVWRNWGLIPASLLGSVIGAKESQILGVAKSMGLPSIRPLTRNLRRRTTITIIRRNWHILPYTQLLTLLQCSAPDLAYTLREDDFLFVKLGNLKPKCPPLAWTEPSKKQLQQADEIRSLVNTNFPHGMLAGKEPLLAFIDTLNRPAGLATGAPFGEMRQPLRMSYSYYALYGDPLLDPSLDAYPDGYLARVASAGVNAVWLQGVLAKLATLPWSGDKEIDRRRAALRALTAKAGRHGVKIFLYLNEPRSLPSNSEIFARHPEWRGVNEGEYSALCTSQPEIRRALSQALESLCRDVPELGGFFTITASENLTNCWSHRAGAHCPRCKERRPSEVIAEVISTFEEGLQKAGGKQRLLAWDWGWGDDDALKTIELLPSRAELMSVSEWDLPIERGGVKSTVGEYSLSSIGPGPRALRHWTAARRRGLNVVAKIQCANSWEIAAVPYLPAVENVARHALALREAGVDSFMLGWTLGGHPSPNLAAVVEITSGGSLESLAIRLHGREHATAVLTFWRDCSAAFREFPFHVGCVYSAPFQVGPANPLWPRPTGYHATMTGIPYDDLDAWRAIYPSEVFVGQLEKVAQGLMASVEKLQRELPNPTPALAEELRFAEAASVHFASVANQSLFILSRQSSEQNSRRELVRAESELARRLHRLQGEDSRLGFEASNQYFYVPLDLVEKVLNCAWIAEGVSP
jgi:hypothetical protein